MIGLVQISLFYQWLFQRKGSCHIDSRLVFLVAFLFHLYKKLVAG